MVGIHKKISLFYDLFFHCFREIRISWQCWIVLLPVYLFVGICSALSLNPLILFPVCCILSLALGTFLYPPLALLLVVLSASLPSIDVSLGGYHIHLVVLAILLCFCVILTRRPSFVPGYPHVLALFFFLIAAISFLHVPEIANALSPYSADRRLTSLAMMVSMFFCSSLLASYIKNKPALLCACLFCCLPAELVGLDQICGMHLLSVLTVAGSNDPVITGGRLWGPFPWSVNFAMYLIIVLAISVACWLEGIYWAHRLAGAMVSLLTGLLLISTGTRSVVLAAIVMLFIAFVITRSWKKLILVAFSSAPMIVIDLNNLVTLFTHDQASAQNRWLLWSEALTLIKSHFWLGIGLEQFHYYYSQLIVGQADQLGPAGIHPHEQYLEWAMESGISWLVVALLLLAFLFISCLRGYRSASAENRPLMLAVLLALVANCVIGFFDVPFDQLESSVFFFLLMGLMIERTRPVNGSAFLVTQEFWHVLPRWRWKRRLPKPRRLFQGMLRSEEDRAVGPSFQRTGSSILAQLVSWGIAIPLVFPMTALLTHYLGPDLYGDYSLIFPFLSIFALLSGTGMDPLIIRQLRLSPRSDWHDILNYAVGTRLTSSLLSMILALAIALFLPVSNVQRMLFILGGCSLLFSFSFNGLRVVYTHGYRAEQRLWLVSSIEVANRLFTLVFIAVVLFLHLGIISATFLLIYSDLPAFILLVWLASRRYSIRPLWNYKRFRTHMVEGLPLLGHNALTLIAGQADLFILLLVCGSWQAGLYALASRITDPLLSAANACVNGFYPLFCTRFREGITEFARVYHIAFRCLALCLLPLAVLITFQAHEIILLLGGITFSPAAVALRLLIWSMVFTFFNLLAEKACTAVGIEARIPLITFVSTLVNIAGNAYLIPRWNIMGAAWVALLSEIIAFSLFIFVLHPFIYSPRLCKNFMLIFLCNIPAILWMVWQPDAAFWLCLCVVIIFTSISYWIAHVFTLNDLRTLYRMLKRA